MLKNSCWKKEVYLSDLKQRQDSLIEEFAAIKDWEERYKKMIQMGKALPALPEALKTEEAKVKGCQSQVWLHAKLNEQGKVELQADSDALLVKGLVAVILKIYSGSTPTEILQTPPDFLLKMGFKENLSPSRSNGLYAMVKQIRYFAMAFQTLTQN
jgi:cysteine desulfuration protein SufE